MSDADYDRIKHAFPRKDIDQELRTAQQWCINHPSRRKTHKRMMHFLCNWMKSAPDRRPGFVETHTDRSWADNL